MNSIKFLTTAVFVMLSTLSMTVFGFLSYMNTNNSIEKKYFNSSELVLRYSAHAFEDVFANSGQLLKRIADEAERNSADPGVQRDRVKSWLDSLRTEAPNHSAIQIGWEDGQIWLEADIPPPANFDPREQSWYKAAKQHPGQMIWTDPYLNYFNQHIVVTAAQAFFSPTGQLTGVAALDYDLSALSRIIGYSDIGEQGLVMLLNSKGTVIASREDYGIGENVFGNEFARVAETARIARSESRIHGKLYYVNAVHLNVSGIMIVTAVSKAEIQENLRTVLTPVFLSGIVCLILFGGIAYIFTLWSIRPLRLLGRLMEAAEQGNYEVRADFCNYREIDTLSKGFNRMVEGIRRRDEAFQASAARVAHLARYDTLTGLLNRHSLTETVSVLTALEPSEPFGLIYIDLDNFKTINDSLGHQAGDEVLKETAVRLLELPHPSKDIARIGGDEFVIVVKHMDRMEELIPFMEQIMAVFSRPVLIDKHRYTLTASVGAAVYPEHGGSMELLLQKADTAMYSAKGKGKNGFQVFQTSDSV